MRDLDDTALERRLREVLEEHLGALPLDLTVETLDRRREARGVDRPFGRSRGITLLAAAAAVVLVGGALAAGSGVLRRPPVVPPVTAPSLGPLAVASAEATAPSPSDLARPSPSPIPADGPGYWIRTGSMITPRHDNVAVRLLDGRVLVAGGQGRDGSLTSAELYDPGAGTWSATGSLLHPIDGIQATLLRDGRVLVGGGNDTGAELYDPATGTWTTTGQRTVGWWSATLLADGRVLVPGSPSRLYDPVSGTWSATGNMIAPCFNQPTPVRLLDGRVLVACNSIGHDVPTKAVELYDPSTGTWSATGSRVRSASGLGLLLLSDGRVLAENRGYEPELYDPVTGSWTMAPSTGAHPFLWGTAALLTDGKVLDTASEGDPASWLYDPANGSWTRTGRMLPDSAEGDLTALTVLLDGTVLAEGGSVCCPNAPLAGAQLYIPAGVSPPTGLTPVPSPTPTPTPTPSPTPFPPAAGPVPHGARPWEVTVENKSSKPVTLFLAREPLNDMGDLCGAVTPDIVPAGVTEKVTFQLPPKNVNDCWLMIRPGPGADGALGPTDNWPTPGKLVISDGGDNANGDDLSTVWQGP